MGAEVVVSESAARGAARAAWRARMVDYTLEMAERGVAAATPGALEVIRLATGDDATTFLARVRAGEVRGDAFEGMNWTFIGAQSVLAGARQAVEILELADEKVDAILEKRPAPKPAPAIAERDRVAYDALVALRDAGPPRAARVARAAVALIEARPADASRTAFPTAMLRALANDSPSAMLGALNGIVGVGEHWLGGLNDLVRAIADWNARFVRARDAAQQKRRKQRRARGAR